MSDEPVLCGGGAGDRFDRDEDSNDDDGDRSGFVSWSSWRVDSFDEFDIRVRGKRGASEFSSVDGD